MKTKLFFLLFLGVSVLKAGNNPDTLLNSGVRPIITQYLERLDQLCLKLNEPNYPDSVRFYSKKIMKLSDDMERRINRFYRYSGSRMSLAQIFILNGNATNYAYAMILKDGGPQPEETILVNQIYDAASNIRYFRSKNPVKIKKNLEEIMELKKNLLQII